MKRKTAIVTGASRGIGRAIALAMGSNGFNVVLLSRSIEETEETAGEIRASVGDAVAIRTDVTSEEDVRNAVESALHHFGSVDVLISNAGTGRFGLVEEMHPGDYREVMDVNVKGLFLLARSVIPHMKSQKSGQIVVITSDVSRRTFERGSLYCASKYAQDALVEVLRKELLPSGIKVSSILPGVTATYFDGNPPSEAYKQQWLAPETVASAVMYIVNAPDGVIIDEVMLHPVSQRY